MVSEFQCINRFFQLISSHFSLDFSLAKINPGGFCSARVTDSSLVNFSLYLPVISFNRSLESYERAGCNFFLGRGGAGDRGPEREAKERVIEGGVNFHKFPVICAPFLDCPFPTKYTVRGTSMKMVL